MSKYWGKAQGLYYQSNPDTRGKIFLSASLWSTETVRSMLDFSLHLWNNRCDTMHGIDEEDAKRILKNKITATVVDLYGRKEAIEAEYEYLFRNQSAPYDRDQPNISSNGRHPLGSQRTFWRGGNGRERIL